MTTIKSFTDLQQSKKLAEILPLDSADMCYPYDRHLNKMYGDIPYVMGYKRFNEDTDFPCWSLASLLGVLPKICYFVKDHPTYLILGKPKDKWCALYWDTTGMQDGKQTLADNPVDACVAMVEKLHELKAL